MKNFSGYRFCCLYLAVLLLVAPMLTRSQTLAAIDKALEDEMINQQVPGMVVGVISQGRIVHARAYGFQDAERTQALNLTDVVRIASVSKLYTAIAIHRLVETGKIGSLDDKVIKYVGYWPGASSVSDYDKKRNITIRQLLTHRSGIGHYSINETPSAYKSVTGSYNAGQGVDVFKNPALVATPGDTMVYSTFAYNLLGAVVEGASGQPYNAYLNSLASSFRLGTLRPSTGDFSGFIKSCDGSLQLSKIGQQEWKTPGGGLETTVPGMLNLMMALMQNNILKDPQPLWETVAANTKDGSLYRQGVEAQGSGSSLRVWHGGAHGNLRTLFHYFPDAKNGVVVFANAEFANTNRIAARVYSALNLNVFPNNTTVDYLCNSTVHTGCGNRYFTATFHKQPGKAVLRNLYSMNAFNKEWNTISSNGYNAVKLLATNQGGTIKWSALFHTSDNPYALWRNFTEDQFHTKWDEMRRYGLVLTDLEVHQSGNTRYFSGLFSKTGDGAKTFYISGVTAARFNEIFQLNKSKGLNLVDIEIYNHNGQPTYAGVWREGSRNGYKTDVPESSVVNQINSYQSAGYIVVDLDRRHNGSGWVWDMVISPSTTSQKIEHRLSYCDLMTKANTYRNTGYIMTTLEEYD
ncbi:serine hydrolase domain-containing protein [Flavihumibacter stibioxidans]|nr:serine hydrolase domain-containing protein [Flavihumibacter stibioxidans]